MCHVGYVYAYLVLCVLSVLIRQPLERQGVVKILGVSRIDGEGEHIAHIAPAVNLLCADVGIYLFGLLHRLVGIVVRQSVLGKYSVHLCLVLSALPQHLNHLTHRRTFARGGVDDLHDHLVAILRTV